MALIQNLAWDVKNYLSLISNVKLGSPANIRGSLSEESTQPEHEEGQVGYASELSTEAFDFGVERFG